eukprot:10194234-Prorocentrum_lima.AAC.1
MQTKIQLHQVAVDDRAIVPFPPLRFQAQDQVPPVSHSDPRFELLTSDQAEEQAEVRFGDLHQQRIFRSCHLGDDAQLVAPREVS